jgi:rfaE bifunctional protein kinase chain/domain
MNFNNIKMLTNRIKKKNPKILVIGDLMLDSYVFGLVERISPEAPVPIINYRSQKNTLGGCGNVAHNLKNLGVNVSILSMVGDDEEGRIVKSILEKLEVKVDGLFIQNESTTTKKTRFVSGNSQLLRLDNDSYGHPNKEIAMGYIKKNIEIFDSIIVSDYNKGFCSNELVGYLIKETKKFQIPVFVDPKGHSWKKYSNSFCITPNTKELELVLKTSLVKDSEFEKAARSICEKYKIKSCLITRGADGMTLFDGEKIIHQKVGKKEVFDVSGAGDTVISCISASYSSGLNFKNCLDIAATASSEVVAHVGTTPFHLDFLIND